MDRPCIVFHSKSGTPRFPALLTRVETAALPVRSIADHLSLTGFSFRTPEPFGIGERLDCVIDLAFANSPSRLLRAQLEVCRIHLNLDGFRIGCRIHESSFVGTAALPAWASVLAGTGE